MPIPSRTLSIAHEALAVIAGIGLVLILAIVWDDASEIDIGRLRRPSQGVMLVAVTFLYAACWVEFRCSDALRAKLPTRGAAWLHLAAVYALVLAAATWSMMRGDQSRAYLAGLNQPLAALGTVGCLGLALAIVTWISGRAEPPRAEAVAAPARSSPTVWTPWALATVAALALAATLSWLEWLPLPHA